MIDMFKILCQKYRYGRLPSSQVFLISSEKHFQACLDKFRPIYLNQMKNIADLYMLQSQCLLKH